MASFHAAELGLAQVGDIACDEQDGVPRMRLDMERYTGAKRTTPHLTLTHIDVLFRWTTNCDTPSDPVHCSPFASHLSLAHRALLEDAMLRFTTYHLVRRYPLIFGTWHNQMDVEAQLSAKIHQSIASIISRSSNEDFRATCGRLMGKLHRQQKAASVLSAAALRDYIGLTDDSHGEDPESESEADTDGHLVDLRFAMQQLYRVSVKRPRFKGSHQSRPSRESDADDEELALAGQRPSDAAGDLSEGAQGVQVPDCARAGPSLSPLNDDALWDGLEDAKSPKPARTESVSCYPLLEDDGLGVGLGSDSDFEAPFSESSRPVERARHAFPVEDILLDGDNDGLLTNDDSDGMGLSDNSDVICHFPTALDRDKTFDSHSDMSDYESDDLLLQQRAMVHDELRKDDTLYFGNFCDGLKNSPGDAVEDLELLKDCEHDGNAKHVDEIYGNDGYPLIQGCCADYITRVAPTSASSAAGDSDLDLFDDDDCPPPSQEDLNVDDSRSDSDDWGPRGVTIATIAYRRTRSRPFTRFRNSYIPGAHEMPYDALELSFNAFGSPSYMWLTRLIDTIEAAALKPPFNAFELSRDALGRTLPALEPSTHVLDCYSPL
ncbi:hypothetical protein HDZ31DRAFT_60378 [Schizophyllum fasciatum]